MLYKGLVYIPNNETLKHKVVQQFHDNIMGHPGQWKTLELITREFTGQEWRNLSNHISKDAPHAKLPRSDPQLQYHWNPMKYPRDHGKLSQWTSSQTSPHQKDSIVSSQWWIDTAKQLFCPLVTRPSQQNKPANYYWIMCGNALDFQKPLSQIEDYNLWHK